MSRQDNIIWEKEPNFLYDEEYKQEVFNNEYQEYLDELYDEYGLSRDVEFNKGSDVLNRRNYDTDWADEEDAEWRAELEDDIQDFDDWYEEYVNNQWEIEQYAIREDWDMSIAPAIDSQIKNGCLFLVGYRADQLSWKNGGGHVQFSDADGLFDWLCDFDDAELIDDDGVIEASGHDHDGSTSGTLYTLTEDRDILLEVAKANGYMDEADDHGVGYYRQYYSSSYSDEDIAIDLLLDDIKDEYMIEVDFDKLLVPIKNTIWG